MQILTPTEARKNLFSLIDSVYENGEVLIKGKKRNAILVSEQEWSGMQETLYLHSIPGMVESILAAAAEPIEDCLTLEEFYAELENEEIQGSSSKESAKRSKKNPAQPIL